MSNPSTNVGSRDPLIGTILKNAYKITGVIGQGGMGTVYRAEQLAIGREVAIKMLRRDFGDQALAEQAAARFTREAQVTSRLMHPNTVRVIDFGSTGGRLYLVLELLEGESLADVLAREVILHPTRAALVGRQIALSLTEAHAQGVVHRDIKPDNIFLCEGAGHKDFVKVVDFGIAGTREAATQTRDRLTSEHAVVGSAHYMSPEQAEGLNVGPHSDLYSLGVVLYEMLTGDPPFNHDSVFKIMVMHATEEPAKLEFSSNMPPLVAQTWRSLVGALLAKDPRDRPKDAATVADELEWIREKSAASGFDVGRLTTSRRESGTKLPPAPVPPKRSDVTEDALDPQVSHTAVHAPISALQSALDKQSRGDVPPSLQTLDTLAEAGDDETLVKRGGALAYWGLAAMAAIVLAVIFWPSDPPSEATAQVSVASASSKAVETPAVGASDDARASAAPKASPSQRDAVVQEASMARVEFAVKPDGTEVLAGDQVWCSTPCTHTVKAGMAVNIAFRRPGHRAQSMTVPALKPDELMKVERSLQALAGVDDGPTEDAAATSEDAATTSGDVDTEVAGEAGGPDEPTADDAEAKGQKSPKKTKRKRKKKRSKFGLPGFRPSK